jgi:hypothetical protein
MKYGIISGTYSFLSRMKVWGLSLQPFQILDEVLGYHWNFFRSVAKCVGEPLHIHGRLISGTISDLLRGVGSHHLKVLDPFLSVRGVLTVRRVGGGELVKIVAFLVLFLF